jgi:protein-arginine deiminase
LLSLRGASWHMSCYAPARMRIRWLVPFSVAMAMAGCNRDSASQPPQPMADLVVDSNRSGALELSDSSEDEHEDEWDAQHGAVFLANLDDDDQDGKSDADDAVVNGQADIADLSPVAVRAWPDAPPTASGTLAVDAASMGLVRIFRVVGPADDPTSYQAEADPTQIALSAADLKAGVSFALEGRDLVSSTQPGAWSGVVELTLTVTDGTKTALTSTDAAKLRVAPLVLQWNTAPTERVFFTDAGSDTQTLSDGIATAMLDAPVEQLELDQLGLNVDVWSQDFFDVGYTTKPGPGGLPVGMRIFVRSAQPDRSAGEVVFKHFLGPDRGAIEKHGDTNQDSDHGYSMNSFGNWDVIPPYEKDGVSYPLGRNYWGAVASDPADSPDPGFQDFYRAQKVQPEINVDTSWLMVGHVDEFSSWVKTNTPRGWGMLVASPSRARQMLMDLQTAGSGEVQMFAGKKSYDFNGKSSPAAVSVDAVLANANLMAFSQAAQMHIDDNVAMLKNEIGLHDDEITLMPFLIEKAYGAGLAYQPGTVNLLHVDGKVVIPDPFGPIVNGVDPFKEDLKERLGALGLEVHFADDWDTFHEGAGEVHCGTNVARTIQSAWWETGR